ncbi:GlcG/HbpS family heme-binding protein [Streptomyces niveus]
MTIQLESLSLDDAQRVITAAREKAGEIESPSNVAVVDIGGNLVSHIRMDDAWVGSVDISINKAFTARAFDIATKDLSDNAQPGEQF